MKYYINVHGDIYGYEEDGSQDHLIGDKVAMTVEEVEAFINPPITLEQAKTKKTQEIETAYNTALTADIAYMATTFQADETSIKVLNDTITALDATTIPAGFYWVNKANNKVPMTYVEIKGLATAIALRGQALFGTRFDKKVAIAAAATIVEVEAITW